MNGSGAFLHSKSDIEDQSVARLGPRRGSAGAEEHQSVSVFNPYYDKNFGGRDNNDQDGSHTLSNSQITSELIQQLLKLRSAAAGSGDGCSGGGGSHINSCLDDSDHHPHNDRDPEDRAGFTSPHCQNQCEEDKLFIL